MSVFLFSQFVSALVFPSLSVYCIELADKRHAPRCPTLRCCLGLAATCDLVEFNCNLPLSAGPLCAGDQRWMGSAHPSSISQLPIKGTTASSPATEHPWRCLSQAAHGNWGQIQPPSLPHPWLQQLGLFLCKSNMGKSYITGVKLRPFLYCQTFGSIWLDREVPNVDKSCLKSL